MKEILRAGMKALEDLYAGQPADLLDTESIGDTELRELAELLNQLIGKYGRGLNFYKGVLSLAPDNFAISDIHGALSFVSLRGVEMYGYAEEKEILGRNLLEFLDPAFHAKALENISLMMNGVYTGPAEYLAVRRNGTRFWVEINAEMIRDSEKKPSQFLFVIRDLSFKKEMENKLVEYARQMEYNARTDLMTGCINRTEGIRLLQASLNMAEQTGGVLAVVYLDMDGLKHLNDHYGHSEGDRQILQMVSCVRMNMEPADVLIRMGGDEFILVLSGADATVAEHTVKRIKATMEGINGSDKVREPLSFSFGISCSDERNRLTVEEILHEADQLMYAQKRRKYSREVAADE